VPHAKFETIAKSGHFLSVDNPEALKNLVRKHADIAAPQ
jgi:pimeloyl-ACP methyl ester carboxylesterase